MTDRELIEVLMARLEALEKEVSLLRRENLELRERLARYENPKNSRNSSMAPSKDENRPKKNQSLRRPTGRKRRAARAQGAYVGNDRRTR